MVSIQERGGRENGVSIQDLISSSISSPVEDLLVRALGKIQIQVNRQTGTGGQGQTDREGLVDRRTEIGDTQTTECSSPVPRRPNRFREFTLPLQDLESYNRPVVVIPNSWQESLGRWRHCTLLYSAVVDASRDRFSS